MQIFHDKLGDRVDALREKYRKELEACNSAEFSSCPESEAFNRGWRNTLVEIIYDLDSIR